MTVHKLTAGDGYTYLTKQVAAHDATGPGYDDLGTYYTQKGEAPGVWVGRGLAALEQFSPELGVSRRQMTALFGEGRHPNTDALQLSLRAAGKTEKEVDRGSRLGQLFHIHEAANEFQRRCARAYRELNAGLGRDGQTPVLPEDRAEIRTAVAREMFLESFHREPEDARELSGHLARISRQATTAVAGYDLTFTPEKSVSTLWAIAPREVAAVVEQAHHDAVADVLGWLDEHAAYTRRGANGVQQVDTHGLIAAAFTHRDSRSGDPNLHTHVAVSNKVRALDGAWLALDGRPLFKTGVAASERYNTRIEALLVERLGVRFADRSGTEPGKRPVREIVGIDGPLPRRWSSRRTAIQARQGELSAAFQARHGRPPTTTEAVALAQQANLETRAAKHEPRSYAEQRAAWRADAITVLGSEQALDTYVHNALAPRATLRAAAPFDPVVWAVEVAPLVVATVSAARATWQPPHIRAEVERRARAAEIPARQLDQAVDRAVAQALSPRVSVPLVGKDPPPGPALLRRRDGASVYTTDGTRLYTSTAVLTGEALVLTAAQRADGHAVSPGAVAHALETAAAAGRPLNPAQQQMVTELATSGDRVQLALAPAGTGKTTALRSLALAWEQDGGTVVGLAPSAAAAAVLAEETAMTADTLAKLLWHLDHPEIEAPAWISGIDDRTLVVIDEAGMAGTLDLARTVDHVLGRGGSVRLIGDDRQLAAVGAGGLLRDIAHTRGAVTLSQVMRFTHPDGSPNRAEGAASLALREGDPAALAYYTDHSRIHLGDSTTAADQAYCAWQADQQAGLDSVMVAPTRELVRELNIRARTDRLASTPQPAELDLADGTSVSTGDVIVTRRNDRRLPITPTDWVKNGDRWTVTATRADGSLAVTHHRTGRQVMLPAGYVAEHVELGYATTVHGAQGVTADTCHAIATGSEDRALLYVAMTRGRHANHVYLALGSDGDEHSVITRDALLPPTGVDILSRVLARDTAPVSASTEQRQLTDPALLLGHAADTYFDALTTAAVDHLGQQRVANIDLLAERLLPGLTDAAAYPSLRSHLALQTVFGQTPEQLLTRALTAPLGLADARDPAAVLDWRLPPLPSAVPGAPGEPDGHAAMPWLPAIPAALRDQPEWGPFLLAARGQLDGYADQVAAGAGTWTPSSAPAWAHGLLKDPALLRNLAVWRDAHSTDPADRRPTGPRLPRAADARIQRVLDQHVARHLGEPGTDCTRWHTLAAHVEPRIIGDEYWPTLAERLTTAADAGLDVPGILHRAARLGPLPDEQPAAALWWRLAEHLTPAATAATGTSQSATLRPAWAEHLPTALGPEQARWILADPAWPQLVAAVDHATRTGWDPATVLAAAADLIYDPHTEQQKVRDHQLTTALAWRVELLADPETRTLAGTHTDGASLPPLDDDWFAHLAEHEPPDEAEPRIPQPREERDTPGETTVIARIHVLNEQAAQFFADRYPSSWAAAYVKMRLGTSFVGDTTVGLGYAPDGWTTLVDHLRTHGATDDEIVTAGLGSTARNGNLIDRFRDRLMFPIRGEDCINGWIGRRNPGNNDHQGPKYLNTPHTPAFTKSSDLYGLTENRAHLKDGAAPVLVEGPMDALAVTLAGAGRYVGLAPLGTAFTEEQAEKLLPYLGSDRDRLIVATDNDPAGDLAAERIYARLLRQHHLPRGLVLIGAKDPADLYATKGGDVLLAHLEAAPPLADRLLDYRVASVGGDLSSVEAQVQAARLAATAVAPMPPETWPAYVDRILEAIGIDHAAASLIMFEAGQAWTDCPKFTPLAAPPPPTRSGRDTERSVANRVRPDGLKRLSRAPIHSAGGHNVAI